MICWFKLINLETELRNGSTQGLHKLLAVDGYYKSNETLSQIFNFDRLYKLGNNGRRRYDALSI